MGPPFPFNLVEGERIPTPESVNRNLLPEKVGVPLSPFHYDMGNVLLLRAALIHGKEEQGTLFRLKPASIEDESSPISSFRVSKQNPTPPPHTPHLPSLFFDREDRSGNI